MRIQKFPGHCALRSAIACSHVAEWPRLSGILTGSDCPEPRTPLRRLLRGKYPTDASLGGYYIEIVWTPVDGPPGGSCLRV